MSDTTTVHVPDTDDERTAASGLELQDRGYRPLTAAAVGAGAGLAGGLAFGAVMVSIGFLPTVAAIVRAGSPVVGFIVHLAIAAVIGAGFGILVARQRIESGELLFWGLIYGAVWWLAGPLTILPLLLGDPVRWTIADAQDLLPSLVGHLLYGAVTAAVFAVTARRINGARRGTVEFRTVVSAVAAGMIAGALLALAFPSMRDAGYASVVVGSFAGAGYALLFGVRREGTGPALIRGVVYGFLWWVTAGLTLSSLQEGTGLDWSAAAAREAVPTLPGYLLLGAGTAAVLGVIDGIVRRTLSDDVRVAQADRLAGGSIVPVLHGVLAGLAGGVVFTGVMVAVGFLPRVAALVASGSVVVGLLVHLVISVFIGITYAVFFRGRSFDAASGVGWGVSYGFLWWVLGNLTLLPLLLGSAPDWSASALAASFPSLVGHVAYGAVLGIVYQRLEQRVAPWYLTRSRAARERVLARYEQVLGTAPALWSLIVFIVASIPVFVA
ncbi:hypothetical protein [Nocardia sp. NPDC051750]|uniref:hypothetical protein n=1 Tax=Nocardia sp. NPDC051750 TaxID=3364325 RepID=UPI00379E0E28